MASTHANFAKLIVLLLVFGAMFSLAKAESEPISPLFIVSAETPNGVQEWHVELASDDEARSIGLMNRSSMPAFNGMLFRFDDTGTVNMWMKNTLIPLDMVFITETGRISHIHRGAVPHSLDIISSNGPVRYVLETNAGEVASSGLKVGGKLRHPWFSPGN